MSAVPDYLDVLNPEQREAVFHGGGSAERHPLLILAGAGSGKTRVITTKIAYLIREQGLPPWSILAVTFTNKAAREMAGRARLIDNRAGDAMMRTFHSFGAWFLRRNAALAGLSPGFVIYDDDDTVSLLGTLNEDASKQELREQAALISRAKDYFLSPEDPELDLIDYRPEFRKNYRRYEERLQRIGNADFGDLIKKPVEILQANPDLARRIHDRFRVIMVDEYQDSNIAQFKLLTELAGPDSYLCVVGDDDQSIYRFRGAEVKNILEFPERFPGTDIIRLERNYRSFAPILALASSVVDHNRGRLGKTLKAERDGGKLPTLAFLPDQDEEAAFCAELIERSVAGKKKAAREKNAPALYSDWAILYRTNAQSLAFETELLRRRIPYKVVGSLKFYEREEIKDALALMALLLNPRDEVAFCRIVNKPARGIGGKTLDTILAAFHAGPRPDRFSPQALPGRQQARQLELAPQDTAAAVPAAAPAAPAFTAPAADFAAADFVVDSVPGILDCARLLSLSAKAAMGIETFAALMEKARTLLDSPFSPDPKKDPGAPVRKTAHNAHSDKDPFDIRAGEGLSVCAASLIINSGLAEYHSSHDEINGQQRIGNLQELVNAASSYAASLEGLAEFMEHIELDRSIGENAEENTGEQNPDTVTLITLHNTKGLEFRRVILTGLEQGIFPRDDKEGDDLEEERRLFYVGATRAMDELYLTSCALRRMYGRTSPMLPSIFLGEADSSALRIIGSAPVGFGPGSAGMEGHALAGRRYGNSGREKISSDGKWRQGDRVFHDDQGYGAVIGIDESGGDGPVIRVHFDNGQETRFLSCYQSGAFTRIGNDYYG